MSAASDTVQQHQAVSLRPLPLQKLRLWAHICQTKPSSAQSGLGHLLFTFNPIQTQSLDIKTSWSSSHISGFWPILTLTLPASELNHNICLLGSSIELPNRIISFLQSTGSQMMHYYSWLLHMPTKDKGTFPLKKGASDASPKENPQVEPTKLTHQDSTHSECMQATAPTTVRRTLAVAVFTEPLWHVNLHACPLFCRNMALVWEI